MIATPTFNQIKAQVTAIALHSHSHQAVGIHAKGRWSGDRQQQDGDQLYIIDQCDSPLALRLALQNLPQTADINQPKNGAKAPIHVLITPLTNADLAEDILLRLTKQQLFTIDSWQIVKSLFRATNIDPRLIQHQWIPDALIDLIPANRCAPVMGGFLDAEIMWPLLLSHGLKLSADRPDLAAILKWSTQREHIALYQQAPEDFRTAASNWLTDRLGSATEAILGCTFYSQSPDALPLGLAAEVVYHPNTQNKLDKALGKLEERFLGGQSPSPNVMQTWSTAARQALLELPDQQQLIIQRSDAILSEIGADEFAYLSTVSAKGFNQRLSQLSQHLIALIKNPKQTQLDQLIESHQALTNHLQVIQNKSSRRIERINMALRLAQWLVGRQRNPKEFNDSARALEGAIAHYTTTGSFLDWARLTLPIAEPHRELSIAYSKLFETVTTIREIQSQQFATLLKDWTAIGSTRKSILLVEQILESVVAPFAEHHPVLLLVLDGASMAIAHELLADVVQQGWQLITNEAQGPPMQAGLAAIPSVTEVSRNSLLCGQLQKGQQAQETKGFSQHPALRKHCKRNKPPLLFHKKGLQEVDTPHLSEALYSAISSPQNQVIGLVINAVDDLLNKGEQVDIAWTSDRIKVLSPILEAARIAQRLVIITSDHGHIIHHGVDYKKAGKGGERWREDNGTHSAQELQVVGDRVLATESSALIAPWTEKLRYCSPKKKGYHGGITPQEMIVPVATLSPVGMRVEGSQATDIKTPFWWSTIEQPDVENILAPCALSGKTSLGPLFSYHDTFQSATQSDQATSWIERLLHSPIYQDQLQVVGHPSFSKEWAAQILSALLINNSHLLLAQLAQVTSQPVNTLEPLLKTLQGVLNIDGYMILTYDDIENQVTLNERLLRQQFNLDELARKDR